MPLNYLKGMKKIRSMIIAFRFVEHLICMVLIYTLSNGANSALIVLQVYAFVSFIFAFSFYVYFRLINVIQNDAVSTNRTLNEMIKLELYQEIEQMDAFGFKYSNKQWSTVLKNNETAVYRASNAGCCLVFTNLFASYENDAGLSPLMYSLKQRHFDTVDKLIKLDKTIVNDKITGGWTPLNYASSNNLGQIVDKLIAADAIVDETDVIGWTPLVYASSKGHYSIVEK